MSEVLSSSEKNEQLESSSEHLKRQHELLNEAKKEASKAEHEHAQKIEQIRDLVNQEAIESSNKSQPEQSAHGEPEEANTYWYSREYRELAFKQLMGRVRTHMSKPERVASKLIHRPGVEKASEIGEKTVARTSGVLVGSLCSLIASLATYYFSRRNGYDMTYSVFIISFIGGFFAGLLLEFVFKTARTLLSRS